MTSRMNLKKRLLSLAAVFLFIPSISGASAQTSEPKANGEAASKKRQATRAVEVVWQGRKFRRGDRVRVTSWAGTIKPDESGHPAELNADAGRTGTVIRGAKRQATSYFKPDPDEPIQILLVKLGQADVDGERHRQARRARRLRVHHPRRLFEGNQNLESEVAPPDDASRGAFGFGIDDMTTTTETRTITVAHSPDSDDAFMFYGLATDKIDTGDLRFEHVLEDIQTLNEKATRGVYDVTAISFHAYAYLADKYVLLPHGASIGDGYGPIVVAREPHAVEDLPRLKIAVPGKLTSAFLALRILCPEFEYEVVPFDRIIEAVQDGPRRRGAAHPRGAALLPEARPPQGG